MVAPLARVALAVDGDERLMLVADAVLEGVFDKRDEKQWRHADASAVVGVADAEVEP